MTELSYQAEAAAEYDRAFSHVSTHFLSILLRAARLAPGQRVLDVATGTGIAAEAALGIVGPAGSVLVKEPSLIARFPSSVGIVAFKSMRIAETSSAELALHFGLRPP